MREVGNDVIEKFNLTKLKGHDQFLMSFTDFVSVSVYKGVVKQIITTDGLATYIFSRSHLFKLGQSLTRVFAETYASFHVDRFLSQITNSTTRKNIEIKLNMTDEEDALVDLAVHGIDIEHLMHDIGIFAFHYTRENNQSSNFTTKDYNNYIFLDNVNVNISHDRQNSNNIDLNLQHENHTSRRLLQTIREYTSLTASSSEFKSFLVADKVVDNWLEVCTLISTLPLSNFMIFYDSIN
jgi:hypothetical protein